MPKTKIIVYQKEMLDIIAKHLIKYINANFKKEKFEDKCEITRQLIADILLDGINELPQNLYALAGALV